MKTAERELQKVGLPKLRRPGAIPQNEPHRRWAAQEDGAEMKVIIYLCAICDVYHLWDGDYRDDARFSSPAEAARLLGVSQLDIEVRSWCAYNQRQNQNYLILTLLRPSQAM